MALKREATDSPPGSGPLSKKWGFTTLLIDTFSYTWIINNFSFTRLREPGTALESPQFSSSVDDKLKWYMKFYPNGGFGSDEWSSIYLCLATVDESRVEAKIRFSILSDNGKENIVFKAAVYEFSSEQMNGGIRNFIRRDCLLQEEAKLLPHDKLTIRCEVSIYVDVCSVSGPKFVLPPCKMSRDIGHLLESDKFTDVTFNVSGEEFRAHRAILAARSPVFASMLKHKSSKREKRKIDIVDFKSEVFAEVLRFIYSDRVTNLKKLATDLLAAADRYCLERLKVLCEEELCLSLTDENAADVLILADRHSAAQLKTQTIDYISRHALNVTNTLGYRSMAKTHPHLMDSVFRALAARHDKIRSDLIAILPETVIKKTRI